MQRSGGIGIDVMRGGSVTNGSTIAENAGHGSPITIDENTITGNQGDGVMGYHRHRPRAARQRDQWQVGCRLHGKLPRPDQPQTIENNWGNGITLLWGAKLILEEPATTVSGNRDYALWCGDSESSFMAMDPLDTTDPILCADFNH